jgi:hypothetical protein
MGRHGPLLLLLGHVVPHSAAGDGAETGMAPGHMPGDAADDCAADAAGFSDAARRKRGAQAQGQDEGFLHVALHMATTVWS